MPTWVLLIFAALFFIAYRLQGKVMANKYKAILDATVAAFKPVTGKLITRFGRNADAINLRTFRALSVGGSTTNTSFEVQGSFQLFIPDVCIGEDGTRMLLHVPVWVGSSSESESRLVVGGNFSNVVVETNVTPQSREFILDWTPTANTVVTVDFETKVSAGAGAAFMVWDNVIGQFLENYIASLPRAAP